MFRVTRTTKIVRFHLIKFSYHFNFKIAHKTNTKMKERERV